MTKYLKSLIGLTLAGAISSSVASAATKYIGTRDGVDAAATSEYDIAAQDGGADDSDVAIFGVNIPGQVTWRNLDEWVLQDIVVVTNGTLRIQEGTIIRGQPQDTSTTYNPGALVISRTAKIVAVGSPADPIVFTTAAVSDTQYGAIAVGATPAFWDLNPSHRPLYNSFGTKASGRWGGLVVLGNAPTNVDRTPFRSGVDLTTDLVASRSKVRIAGEPDGPVPTEPADGAWAQNSDDRPGIEGIPTLSDAFIDGLDRYGGHNAQDNSGVIQYVSVKFGGAEIAANNELNGITLGGVGSETIIDSVEIFGNTDDGIEIFGGTVNITRALILGVEDDSLDIDVGFTGTVQYLLAIAADQTDRMGEWDGSYEGETVNGFSSAEAGTGNPGPVNQGREPTGSYGIFNATFIGNLAATGSTATDTTTQGTNNNDRNHGILVRDQSSAVLVNSVVVNPRGYGLALGERNSTAIPINENDVTARFEKGYARLQAVTFAKDSATAATLSTWTGNANTAFAQDIIESDGPVDGFSEGNEVRAVDDDGAEGNGGVVFANLPVSGTDRFLDGAGGEINPIAFDALPGFLAGPDPVQYRGAFNPADTASPLWTAVWSVADQLSIIVTNPLDGF